MKAIINTLPIKFDIWDTCYTIADHGDKIEIKCPCRNYKKGSGGNNWGLGFATQIITNPNIMALIRKMVDNGKAGLAAKDSFAVFTVEDVINGAPTAYGWQPADFD